MFKRLDVKIIISLAMILAAMIAVYGWRIGSRQQSVYVQSLSNNLRVLSHSYADNAANFLVVQDYAGLESQMMNAAHIPEVLSVLIVEPDGNVLCNVQRPSRGEAPHLTYDVRHFPVPRGREPSLGREGDQLVSWAPILAGNQLGWVRMALTLETAHDLQRAAWRSSLQIGALWLLVGTFLMILVVRPPLRAIRELSRFAGELQDRKGAQVPVQRGVLEIDALADALNHSSARLHEAEKRLVAEQERLAVTLQSIGDGVIATDTECRIVFLNHVAETLTGWKQDEVQGEHLDRVLRIEGGTDDAEALRVLLSVLEARRTLELPGTRRLCSKSGTDRTVTINGAPIVDAADQLGGMVLVIRDVTEKAEMEEERRVLAHQLAQSQKMEAIGQLAGGVAHDFNNMLGVIIGHAELALLATDLSGQMQDRLREILDAASRSAEITRQLLAFSRQQHAEPKVLDLNETIARMLKMLHRLIGEDIDLSWSPGFELSHVRLDPSQLDQVMANLCVNARDAIAGIGKIQIFTDNVTVGTAERARVGDLAPGRYVRLVVADSGCGMSAEVMERIFEPFYTTKQLGRGTGLGLATVFGIVKQNGGHIEVTSSVGKGSVFTLYFPAVSASSLEVAQEKKRPAGGTESVLLVEDEPAIMEIGATILKQLGYRVYPAASPEEAIDIAENSKANIDLLLTDIIMPGMNGRDLSERLLESRPDMKCLFMSGYTADVIAERGKIGAEMCFLQKPFSVESLALKVREALSS
ncbi:ATP-binding protein [Geomonas edaphica]|uniref:ATP-binding protein n=1 Tax=Geomonas edaphica TaxID=2570226 RepID=UPI0010A92C8E|nr:ATP-binding protein [Geomonas edaphica]